MGAVAQPLDGWSIRAGCSLAALLRHTGVHRADGLTSGPRAACARWRSKRRGVGASSVLGRRGAKTLLPRQTPRVQQARQDTEQCSLYIQRPAALGDRWAGMPSTASDVPSTASDAAAAAGLALVAEAKPDACAPPDGSGARGPLVVTLCGHVCDYERLERAWEDLLAVPDAEVVCLGCDDVCETVGGLEADALLDELGAECL